MTWMFSCCVPHPFKGENEIIPLAVHISELLSCSFQNDMVVQSENVKFENHSTPVQAKGICCRAVKHHCSMLLLLWPGLVY